MNFKQGFLSHPAQLSTIFDAKHFSTYINFAAWKIPVSNLVKAMDACKQRIWYGDSSESNIK